MSDGTDSRFARAAAGLVAALATAVLVACGGGGSATADAQYSASYAVGRISGFGSIVVNGVHYDETTAAVTDDDDDSPDDDSLELGMVVEVEASDYGSRDGRSSAKAESITLRSLMRGPVESVGTDSLVVLGQTVQVNATTVFDDDLPDGMGSITAGAVVKVYGTLDTATGTYTATRIDLKSDSNSYRLRGVVSSYDDAQKLLTIGNAAIDVSGLTLDAAPQAGDLVRVKLQTSQAVPGVWVATALKSGSLSPRDVEYVEVEGTITDFTSAQSFSVDGLPVDAGQATFEDGSEGLGVGVRVEVKGAVVDGVLVARKVEIESDDEDEQEGFEIEGRVTGVDPAQSSFVVHGVTVSFAGAVEFVGGTVADLMVDSKVEVHGSLADDGQTIVASRIEFED
jgi:hypothetical protein